MTVAFTDILAARRRIAPMVLRTPLRLASGLSVRAGVPVYLKCEHHQVTGSFKLRGATNAVLALSDAQRAAGVTGASTGNHGRALAHAAKLAGSRAIICMSALVPENKVAAIRALGAEIRIIGNSQDDAQAEVDRLVAEKGMTMVPPFDMADVIAGQGTLGFEIIEDVPDAQMLLVPLSGGGLIAGVALAAKTLNPKIRVIGITMERGAAMAASLAAGKPVGIREVPSLADSLGGGIGLANRFTFPMVRDLVDEVVLVSETDIANAIRTAYFEESEVLEGAAAVAIAALDTGKIKPEGPVVAVLSGRNIDMKLHQQIIAGNNPEVASGRSNG